MTLSSLFGARPLAAVAIGAALLVAINLAFGPLIPTAILIVLAVVAVTRACRDRVSSRIYHPVLASAGLICCALVLVGGPNAAFAATIVIPDALTSSLQDILGGAVAAVISALIGWIAITLKTKFNIDIEAQHRNAIATFAQRQANSLIAAGAVKLNGVKIDVHSDTLAVAANAALVAIPDALKAFKLTPDRIADMIVAALPKQPAIAQAQAIAIDVVNPGTPSTGPLPAAG